VSGVATLIVGPTEILAPDLEPPTPVRALFRYDEFADEVAAASGGLVVIREWPGHVPEEGPLILDRPTLLGELAGLSGDATRVAERAIVLGVERGDLLAMLADSRAAAIVSSDRYRQWLHDYRRALRNSIFVRRDLLAPAPGLVVDPEGFALGRHLAIDPTGATPLPVLVGAVVRVLTDSLTRPATEPFEGGS
jgi:hypothetical protein